MQKANIANHLEELQVIANAHDGSRAMNLGFNASANYVVAQIARNTDYSITIQPFAVTQMVEQSAPKLAQTAPDAVTYQRGRDFTLMTYSGSGDVVAPVSYVGEGCKDGDWSGFTAGNIALAKRGDCSFGDKADKAEKYGAPALLIFNSGESGNEGLFSGTLGAPSSVVVFGIPYDLGIAFESTSGLVLAAQAHTEEVTSYTRNVIAETQTGDASKTIVVGSHLDSVPAGPGINDNGSGTSANLEMAIQFAKENPKNRVRFAWWAAEELGLLGSKHYVQELVNSGDIKNIALNLNFDMLGSPNYFRGIYNGSGAEEPIRKESEALTAMFAQYFDDQGLVYNLTEFNGRSDYGPFIENGVPAGGLATGAEVKKDMQMRDLYGGFANTPFDPCYHNECDTIQNVDQDVLLEMGRAAAYVLYGVAMDENLPTTLATGKGGRVYEGSGVHTHLSPPDTPTA
eukprot:TRINITY_DN2350_c0_g1_i1.p1 TRINITY_DN2350_c0_g1~~TRINITY_DN2350_c0_g1_i1.p1  ORF type:complete len:532 (-),score=154.54 TRINITY_DN2350_c0_g1_i1:187-1557(-)